MADLTIPQIMEICKDFPNPPSQKILANQQFLAMYRNFAKETLVAQEQEKNPNLSAGSQVAASFKAETNAKALPTP